MDRRSGRIGIRATAVDAIHHGRGTIGNVQLLRTQEIMGEDGDVLRVPFVSGNSIKHMIRDGGVRFALEAMAVADGSLTKPVVDLLFSGGHLSKSGAAVNLKKAREVAELFPILAVCGYSAGNFMQASKLSVSNWHLVCEENVFRLPEDLKGHGHATRRAAAFCGEEFGTRHEAGRDPRVHALLTDGEKKRLEDGRTARHVATAAGDRKKAAKPKDSSQMIYDYEVLLPGSILSGEIRFFGLGELETAAFKSALEYACVGRHGEGFLYTIGAKSSVGVGRVSVEFAGEFREMVTSPAYEKTAELSIQGGAGRQAYVEHLRGKREEILGILGEIMA